MHIASRDRSGEDWHFGLTTVSTFGTDSLFFDELLCWRSQMLSENEDNTKAFRHRLFEFVPYFQRVMSQEGKFTLEHLHSPPL